MTSEEFDKIQIHLANHGSNAAVLQRVNVPTGFTNWSPASGHASFGRQPAVLRKENRIPNQLVALSTRFVRRKLRPCMGVLASEKEAELFSTIP
jgi:hypothetical protein